jgi:hypothetical protein
MTAEYEIVEVFEITGRGAVARIVGTLSVQGRQMVCVPGAGETVTRNNLNAADQPEAAGG